MGRKEERTEGGSEDVFRGLQAQEPRATPVEKRREKTPMNVGPRGEEDLRRRGTWKTSRSTVPSQMPARKAKRTPCRKEENQEGKHSSGISGGHGALTSPPDREGGARPGVPPTKTLGAPPAATLLPFPSLPPQFRSFPGVACSLRLRTATGQ